MKQVILFVAPMNAVELVPAIKSDVVEYLGQRMIEDDFRDMGAPLLGLSEKLPSDDKDKIVRIVRDRSEDVIIFVLHEKEVGNLDQNKKIMEFIQYEEPVVL
jgi:hypothetical protein